MQFTAGPGCRRCCGLRRSRTLPADCLVGADATPASGQPLLARSATMPAAGVLTARAPHRRSACFAPGGVYRWAAASTRVSEREVASVRALRASIARRAQHHRENREREHRLVGWPSHRREDIAALRRAKEHAGRSRQGRLPGRRSPCVGAEPGGWGFRPRPVSPGSPTVRGLSQSLVVQWRFGLDLARNSSFQYHP